MLELGVGFYVRARRSRSSRPRERSARPARVPVRKAAKQNGLLIRATLAEVRRCRKARRTAAPSKLLASAAGGSGARVAPLQGVSGPLSQVSPAGFAGGAALRRRSASQPETR